MNQPLVTVGVALYNYEDYIVQCLESIVKQDYSNIELIVIDDGSTDNSYQVAKDYLDNQTHLTNVQIISRPNRGMCSTHNDVIDISKGEFTSFCGADDYWKLDKISDHANFLMNNPDISLVHSNSVVVDGNGKEGKESDFAKKINSGIIHEDFIYRRGGIHSASTMLRSKVYDEIGNYDTDFRWEDTDFFLRLTKKHKIGFVNKVHTYYRKHGSNMSDNKNRLTFLSQELLRIYEKNIDNPKHKKYLVLRVYKKATEAALKTMDLKNFFLYLGKYWRLKLFNSGLTLKHK